MANRNRLYFIAFIMMGGAISVMLGQDINFDLKNYHFYNPYAFLTNRHHYDFAPAQVQSYLNPLFDILYYKLVTVVKSAILVTFIMGFWYGLFAWATLKLILLIPIKQSRFLTTIATILSITGVAAVGQIGVTTNEVAIAAIMIYAITMALTAFLKLSSAHITSAINYFMLSGLLCGITAGIKLTQAFFALALWLSIFTVLVFHHRSHAAKVLVLFSTCALAGFLITGGYWHYYLWQEYQNPFFPFFNKIFQSHLIEMSNLVDPRYRAETAQEFFLLPFMIAKKNFWLVAEGTMADSRLLLGYLSIIIVGITLLYRRIKGNIQTCASGIPANVIIFFISLWFFSYAIWAYISGIHRYVVVLEPLSVIVFLTLLSLFTLSTKRTVIVLIIMTLAIAAQTTYLQWGRLHRYGINTIEVFPPTIEDNALVIMTSGRPLSYIIPFFKSSIKFVSPQSNFLSPTTYNFLLQKQVNAIVNEWEGPMYALVPSGYNFANDSALTAYSLKVDYLAQGGCQAIISNIEYPPPQLCVLLRE
jgi:hypothetical protein